MSEVWGAHGGRGRGKATPPRQPEWQHKGHEPPETSSLYCSLLIGYRVQALTVVKPESGEALLTERPPGADPWGGRWGPEAPKLPHPIQP